MVTPISEIVVVIVHLLVSESSKASECQQVEAKTDKFRLQSRKLTILGGRPICVDQWTFGGILDPCTSRTRIESQS